MAQLKSQMLAMLKAEGDPRASGNGAIFDTYEYTKNSPKDYDTWLKSQNEMLSAVVDKDASNKKAKKSKGDSK
jgi:hypothetical protein